MSTCVQTLSGGSSCMALLHDVAEQDLGGNDVVLVIVIKFYI